MSCDTLASPVRPADTAFATWILALGHTSRIVHANCESQGSTGECPSFSYRCLKADARQLGLAGRYPGFSHLSLQLRFSGADDERVGPPLRNCSRTRIVIFNCRDSGRRRAGARMVQRDRCVQGLLLPALPVLTTAPGSVRTTCGRRAARGTRLSVWKSASNSVLLIVARAALQVCRAQPYCHGQVLARDPAMFCRPIFTFSAPAAVE